MKHELAMEIIQPDQFWSVISYLPNPADLWADKERILSLSPLIENGFFKWKENHNKTIDQLTMYPKSEFDDLQDACYYAWEVSQNTTNEAFAFKLQTAPARLKAALSRFRR